MPTAIDMGRHILHHVTGVFALTIATIMSGCVSSPVGYIPPRSGMPAQTRDAAARQLRIVPGEGIDARDLRRATLRQPSGDFESFRWVGRCRVRAEGLRGHEQQERVELIARGCTAPITPLVRQLQLGGAIRLRSGIWRVSFEQVVEGHPVLGARVVVDLSETGAAALGVNGVLSTLRVRPAVTGPMSAESAEVAAWRALDQEGVPRLAADGPLTRTHLVWLSRESALQLAWYVVLQPAQGLPTVAIVGASDGHLLLSYSAVPVHDPPETGGR